MWYIQWPERMSQDQTELGIEYNGKDKKPKKTQTPSSFIERSHYLYNKEWRYTSQLDWWPLWGESFVSASWEKLPFPW